MRQSPLFDGSIGRSFPTACSSDQGGLTVVFQDTPSIEFSDPFSDWTTARLAKPSVKAAISLEEIDRLGDAEGAPAGLIFHVARCGSTLVAQSLKALDGLTVYSEPAAFNDLLMPPADIDRAAMLKYVRALGGLLARHAQGPYIIKLRSWNALFADVLTTAFPKTPWAFIVRNPVEVAVSVLAKPPTWLRARSAPLNPFQQFIDLPSSAADEDYVASMFAAFCEKIRNVQTSRGLIVDYTELPAAAWTRIAPHFHLNCSEREHRMMVEIGHYYSKSPIGEAVSFKPDGADKYASASSALVAAINARAFDAWTGLSFAGPNLRTSR